MKTTTAITTLSNDNCNNIYILLLFIRLGVSHDGRSASCPNNQYVMAGSVPGGKMAGTWTTCSKLKIQTLLR